ncbi:alpha/beta hydrolase fold domain-containing protein [Microbacterium sp. NEAU-LLC]|uniref:Alpha/beta hydrolase fold domain-containing protein n=1 Tax=Microbacterium helvum TaxID=2773713 RepID=A0ABR8NLD2_9MICO|nr:alpha/beta hydrolase fold domain-containing protein [Microbacterium helvum]MBD3941252.1 alpha/beta hydrolase fold domain-containing protein [Microbacterium helvum]
MTIDRDLDRTTPDANRRHWQAVAAGGEVPPWQELGAEPTGIVATRIDDPPGLWLQPAGGDTSAAVLAVHGGGFVGGSALTHARLFGHLALAAGVPVFAMDYGLVPEHVFPSQLEQTAHAYRWLRARVPRVALAGDSCGALLALGLALQAEDRDAAPRALFLMSPWTDLDAAGASYDHGTDPFFTRDVVRSLADAYLAGAYRHDLRTAPLDADLRDLPPTLVQAGGDEALLDDAVALARRLGLAGVDVRLDIGPASCTRSR